MKKWSILSNVVMSIIIAIIAYIVICLAMNNWNFDTLYYFGYRPTLIITNSMVPTIQVNGIVIVKDVPFEDIKPGDIVRYTNYEGVSVVHRVIYRSKDYLATKGDNNDLYDPFPVYKKQYNGKIVEIHNEYAEAITEVIGKFDVNNNKKSMKRVFEGLLVVSLIISMIIKIIKRIVQSQEEQGGG